ncbi:hypothetical protein RvY_16624 [Ramazzottius varieornatus]|uniref:Uncharacterized protein n=1 Tax=Ramazzottius varieornatus TaxID=947166 RepID=A0A1D1W5H4_RAMVA|nr:hypothetical protein RvY_16624 [Ramazzottius varieornatus]
MGVQQSQSIGVQPVAFSPKGSVFEFSEALMTFTSQSTTDDVNVIQHKQLCIPNVMQLVSVVSPVRW